MRRHGQLALQCELHPFLQHLLSGRFGLLNYSHQARSLPPSDVACKQVLRNVLNRLLNVGADYGAERARVDSQALPLVPTWSTVF